jgi:hypothetical protein
VLLNVPRLNQIDMEKWDCSFLVRLSLKIKSERKKEGYCPLSLERVSNIMWLEFMLIELVMYNLVE